MRCTRAGMKRYLQAAMGRAKFYRLGETGWCSVIPRFQGLVGRGPTKAACKVALRRNLENWVMTNIERRDRLPVVDGLKLSMS